MIQTAKACMVQVSTKNFCVVKGVTNHFLALWKLLADASSRVSPLEASHLNQNKANDFPKFLLPAVNGKLLVRAIRQKQV